MGKKEKKKKSENVGSDPILWQKKSLYFLYIIFILRIKFISG